MSRHYYNHFTDKQTMQLLCNYYAIDGVTNYCLRKRLFSKQQKRERKLKLHDTLCPEMNSDVLEVNTKLTL